MYSQDDIQILYADALTTHYEIKEGSFDILVANPPFAVKGFLETLDEEERKRFELTEVVSDLVKNNTIECFFLERAKQLLKVGGIMGIVVPSSVLSKTETVYVATREMLLQNFDWIAVVEFGNRTFGATGTNTVVLFLRKKDDNPPSRIHYKERVDSLFSPNDELKQLVFEDKHFVDLYCQYIEIQTADYLSFLEAFDEVASIENLLNYSIFKDYQANFQKTAKKIKERQQKEIQRWEKSKKAAQNAEQTNEELVKMKEEHRRELNRELISYIQKIEKDKLYYFVLAHQNGGHKQLKKVLIVKTPTDNTEQKKFLGYEWSKAKGNEGIKKK